jgi:hypothetical protein
LLLEAFLSPQWTPTRQRTDLRAGSLAVTARRVGLKAKELLAVPGFSAEVLAVLSGAVYLSCGEEEILWICEEGSPLHRRGMVTSRLPAVVRKERCFTGPSGLAFDGGAVISLNGVPEWVPLGPEEAACQAMVRARFRQLLAVLDLWEIPDGLGPVIALVSALAHGRTPPAFPPGSLAERMQDRILGLARDCRHQDSGAIALSGRDFIGLGTGLTPSGDDFLGGVFFAVHHLQHTCPMLLPQAEAEREGLLAWARACTHPIGYAIFSDLVEGHGPEALHRLVASLLQEREDPFAAVKEALSLSRIGHSSGWDMLAGFLTGMLAIENSTTSILRGEMHGTG